MFDDGAPSCTGLMARSLATEHGFDLSGFEDLIQWAERIDSASFADAEEAVTLPHPALSLCFSWRGIRSRTWRWKSFIGSPRVT